MQANDVTWPVVAWVCKSMKLGICTGFEHVETKTEEVVFSRRSVGKLRFRPSASPSEAHFILAGGHVRASAGALAVHTALILAEGHVREAPWTWRSTAL